MAQERNKMKAVSIGAISTRLLHDLPQKQVGWLAKALLRLLLDGEEPEQVPVDVLAAWLAIREEARHMAAISEARAEAGRSGGSKPKRQSPRRKQNEAKSDFASDANKQNEAMLASGKANASNRDREGDREYIFSEGTEGKPLGAGAGARAREKPDTPPPPSAHRPSGKKPRGESIGPSDGGGEPFDRAAMEADPYAYLHGVPVRRLPEFAAWYCGEADNAEAKRRYGGFIKAHGAVAFYRMLEEFIGEVRSGEVPDNMGAVLTSRVKEAWR